VNLSEIWIRRPVMTTMVMIGLLLFGILAYQKLPINNLPDVDFPTISVTAALPGASPETMAATVATPLEKKLSAVEGIDSMTSTSTLGFTSITIQFSLARDIDGAALDVNAAINAAMGVLPRTMPNPPVFRKVNPADMPVVMFALTSATLPVATLNDLAENVVIARLSTITGVAEVDVVPPQRYAVRVQVNPDLLARRGIGLNEVADALQRGNVNLPGGTLEGSVSAYTVDSNGQLPDAAAFNRLIVAYQDGYPVRVGDLGRAIDSIEQDRSLAWYGIGDERQRSVVLRVRKQLGANTVQVAERVLEQVGHFGTILPSSVDTHVFYDQSGFIRESMTDVQLTMLLTIALVVAVIWVFIGALRPTVIPSVVVPLSLVATFAVMWLLGYTLNTLSLMALTLSIGFVVDDAIVVLENIIRRVESGESALEAALRGSREIGFTVLSMTLSLAVVFVPIVFMSGILGRLFREFAVCIIAAIVFSGFLSLTLTPTLASRFLTGWRPAEGERHQGPFERGFGVVQRGYGRSLTWVLRHRVVALLFTLAVTAATVWLFGHLPKGFIPTQDQGFFRIFSQVDDRTSFDDMVRHQQSLLEVLQGDPEGREAKVASVIGYGAGNTSLTFITLRPREERDVSVDEVIARLRPRLNQVPGLIVSLVNPPLISVGSRLATAQWQFTMQGSELADLYRFGAIMEEKIRALPALTDVKSDVQVKKPRVEVQVDREKASALGLTLQQIQDSFYSAYGARQVSTIYTASNFYYVILELERAFREDPTALSRLYVKSAKGQLVPISTFARIVPGVAALSVNHAGQMPAVTVSFNLRPGAALSPALDEIRRLAHETLPASITTGFQGTAQAFQASLASMGFLLLVTLVVIYLVLGILYESFIHPVTILTALPLAGFGAFVALWALGLELDIYAWVGIIMLVGIVKKNGIMMIDFALEAERTRQLDSERSIHEACTVRFRPIMMTTMAALFGTLPIAIGLGAGGDARRPLGVAVVGGLLFSQLLTLYVTPVFYVYFDTLSRRLGRRSARKVEAGSAS
jgi:HAE1 family hydrophobic/amphiphilic exporter-1